MSPRHLTNMRAVQSTVQRQSIPARALARCMKAITGLIRRVTGSGPDRISATAFAEMEARCKRERDLQAQYTRTVEPTRIFVRPPQSE
jgi:hypothetical protein